MEHYQQNRRRFLKSTAAASVIAAAPIADAKEKMMTGWIDAHVHVWTPDTAKYPLDKNYTVDAMKPPSFKPEELFAHTKPVGVDRIVLIQMSFYRYDNSYMLDMIKKHHGVFSGVGIVDHSKPDVAQKMRELRDRGVRGFRIHSRGDADAWVDSEGMATVWKTARQEDLAVCPLINPTDVAYVDALCKKFPETKVVVDHFARNGIKGKVDPTELDALCNLARHKNTYVKTSAFYALGQKKPPYKDLIPMIRRVVDAFGPSRLMWASDCPYQVQQGHTYAASIELIRDHIDFLSKADKESILRGTAEKLFFA